MNLAFAMLALSGLAYLAAFGLHLWSFRDAQEKSHRPGFMCMQIGFLIGTFYFAADAVARGPAAPEAEATVNAAARAAAPARARTIRRLRENVASIMGTAFQSARRRCLGKGWYLHTTPHRAAPEALGERLNSLAGNPSAAVADEQLAPAPDTDAAAAEVLA